MTYDASCTFPMYHIYLLVCDPSVYFCLLGLLHRSWFFSRPKTGPPTASDSYLVSDCPGLESWIPPWVREIPGCACLYFTGVSTYQLEIAAIHKNSVYQISYRVNAKAQYREVKKVCIKRLVWGCFFRVRIVHKPSFITNFPQQHII